MPYKNNKKETLFDSIDYEIKKYNLTPVCVKVNGKYYDWEQYVKAAKQEKLTALVKTDTCIVCHEGHLEVVNFYEYLWLEEQSWKFIPFDIPTDDKIGHKELNSKDILSKER